MQQTGGPDGNSPRTIDLTDAAQPAAPVTAPTHPGRQTIDVQPRDGAAWIPSRSLLLAMSLAWKACDPQSREAGRIAFGEIARIDQTGDRGASVELRLRFTDGDHMGIRCTEALALEISERVRRSRGVITAR